MISNLKLIRNNIFSVTSAQIFSLLLNIVTFGIVARLLSIEDFGTFNYFLAIIGFSAKFIDLGVNPIVLRETSKNNNFNEYLGSTLLVKSTLIIFLLLLVNGYSFIVQNSFNEKILLNLFTLNIFFSNKYTNIRELLVTPYKVSLKMSFPMLLVLLDGLLLFLFTLLLKPSEDALLYFGFAYVISNVPSTIILFFMLRKKEGIIFSFNKDILKFVIKAALPIYGYVALTVIYRQMDTLLLGLINDEKAVALYSSAIRLSTPFMIFASAITLTFFPIIVRKLKNNEDISKTVSSILTVLLVFSISISLFVSFHSINIVKIVFGEKYLLSAIPLKYLSIAIVFSFINFFMVDLLTALNKQKLNFIYAILLNFLSVPLYFLILPKFSYAGAGIIKLFAIFAGSIFLFFNLLKKINIKISYIRILVWLLLNILFFLVLNNINFYLALLLETLFIIISVLLINVFNYEELYIIFSSINQEKYLDKIKFLVRK